MPLEIVPYIYNSNTNECGNANSEKSLIEHDVNF